MKKKPLKIVLLSAAALTAALGIYVFASILPPGAGADSYSPDAVVVLFGGRPALGEVFTGETDRRLRHAVRLYGEDSVQTFIVSGGICPTTEGSPELQKIASELGISEKIYSENRSRDTVHNLINSIAIAKERGYKTLSVVASPWHSGRARRLYKREVDTNIELVFSSYRYSEAFPSPNLADRFHDIFYNAAAFAAYRFLPGSLYTFMVENRSFIR